MRIMVSLLIAALLAAVMWLGHSDTEAKKQAPNFDKAFGPPAWHPGDEGVIDLREGK